MSTAPLLVFKNENDIVTKIVIILIMTIGSNIRYNKCDFFPFCYFLFHGQI